MKTFYKFILSIFVCLFIFAKLIYAQCASPISTFPYFQNFETNNGGWTTGGTNTDWTYGLPNKSVITSALSSKCWIIGGLTGNSYNNSELAFVQSPCFNFTNNPYPYIKFKVFWESEKNFDGTMLQYSINGGTNWVNIGTSTDPINCLNGNWYNTNVRYLNNPTGANGWSGSTVSPTGCPSSSGSGAWVTAQHTIPALAGKPTVLFRFLFGAGTSCNNFNGFAFDDVLIDIAPPNNASFTYNCTNSNTVNFTNTSTLCPTLLWNFGDPSSGVSNTSTLANPSHTYATAGTYTVTLNATGPDNAPSTFTQNITVLGLIPSIVTPINCVGNTNGSVTVTTSGGIGPFTYSWNTSPVQNTQTATNLSIGGTYIVTVNAPNTCPANTSIILANPTAVAAPIVSIQQPTCGGTTGIITITNPTAGYTYNFDNSLGYVLSNVSPPMLPSTYNITIKNLNGCISTTTVAIINSPQSTVNTSFQPIAPICVGATLAVLPLTSIQGVTGSWSPAINNNQTTTYTFTPTAGQCASNASLTIQVNQNTTPIFNSIGPLCQNSVPPGLQNISNNNISGTWNPSTINTTSLGNTTYNFTPNAGQCATATSLQVNVATQILAVFNPINNLCLNSIPPILNTTSNNGIVGTWNPSTITTNNIGTVNYVFTPNTGQCATSNFNLSVTVVNLTTPTFQPIASICAGAVLAPIPTTSIEGIIGTWSPVLNNNQTTTYTFTPNAGQCASSTNLTIQVIQNTVPSFNAIGPLCQNIVPPSLPNISSNNISGTWNPSTIDTSTVGSIPYTFTANSGQCATTAIQNIVVIEKPTIQATDVTKCAAGIFNLSATSNGNISWYSNANLTTQVFTGNTYSPNINSTTPFYIVANNAGCSSDVAIIKAIINTATVPISLGNDISICEGEKLVLMPGNFATYTWQDNSTNPNFIVQNAGIYSVTVTNNIGCSGFAKINVFAASICDDIYFPNAFTPNNDTKNDYFGPISNNLVAVKNYTFNVFNRWGEIVFSSNNPYQKWNGSYKGNIPLTGNYTWIANYTYKNQQPKMKKGNVVLVR